MNAGAFDDLMLEIALDADDERRLIADAFDYLHAVMAARFATCYRMLDTVEVST